MSPSLKSTYGVLYRLLYADLADPGFQFVRDAFEEHLRMHWWGLVCRRNGLLTPRTLERHPRRTLHHAAQAARVGGSVVRHLVQAQLVHVDAVTLKSGRQMTTMHEDAVAPLAALVGGAMTLAEAARHAALPERRIRQLINAGRVRPLVSRPNQRAAAWLIAKADLDRMHVQVVGSCGDPTITIRDALKYWRFREAEAMAMLGAVFDGRLQAQADIGCSMPLGLAGVSRQKLRDWLLAFRSARGTAMSIDEASVLLGVKQQVAYELVGRGLLNASDGGANGRKVSPSDLAAFERDFVSLVSLSKVAKRSPRALLDALQVRPVTGPCIDGARQYFYRRDEVEAEQAVPTSPAGFVDRVQRHRPMVGPLTTQGASSDEHSAD